VPQTAARLERLATFSRVIFFDRRGTGASDRLSLDELPTWEDWADDISAVLDAAGSARAAVCADRDAALLAATFAASHPERVSALILYNASARYVHGADYPIGVPPMVMDQILKVFTQRWGTEDMVALFMPSAARDPTALRMIARQLRGACSPRTAGAYFHYLFNFDLRPVLPSISAPTLVLHKKNFSFISMDHARFLAAHIKGARLVELPGRDSALFSTQEGEEAFDAIEEFLTGTPSHAEPDRVLATVLYCDIVDSTSRAAREGDRAWIDLLNRYYGVLRDSITRFGGREMSTAGDGVVVAFDRPSRAVRCAVECRDGVKTLGMEVRCGLHTGECVLGGAQLSGIAMHIGARVAESATAGEVWVSSTVRDLVAGSGLNFDERGAHVLRGINGQYPLYAVA
jgi:class 3 adenylate cyclase